MDAKHEEYLGTTKMLSKSLKLQLADTFGCSKHKKILLIPDDFLVLNIKIIDVRNWAFEKLQKSLKSLILQLSLNKFLSA